MSEDITPELRQEFLDDFYAECDEHLQEMREGLAMAESALAGGQDPTGRLQALLMPLHSLKGISAIVGLTASERLSHAMEDRLRMLTRHRLSLTAGEIDSLLAGMERLEGIIGAHRVGRPLPEIADLLPRLAVAGPLPEEAAPAASAGENPEPASPPRHPLWRCVFSPSAERDARGVNLDAVRARLGAAGKIRQAAPNVRPGGKFVFVFEVERAEPPDLPADAADGMDWERIEAPPAEAAPVSPSRIVRVDLERLDELMRITGELVIQRSRLQDRLERRGAEEAELREISHAIGRALRGLRQAVSRVRMVAIGEIFTRMPFVVRDLTRHSAKRARVVIEGHQTEVDKYVVERLKEPLLHLVRNAFSHGLESPGEREAAGKPAEGTIVLRAATAGDSAIIRIRDDGRGIDEASVAARAQALGLRPPPGAGTLELLCLPGFSTRDEADRESGRGVGMAVVAAAVRELGGRLRLETAPGRGTEFVLQLPLTLSIVEALVVSVGEQRCAVPQSFVREIAEVPADAGRVIRGALIVPWREQLLPVVDLRGYFRMPPQAAPKLTVLVIATEWGSAGLAVDRVHTRREVVAHPLEDALVRRPGLAGAAELGDGRPILILDPLALTARAADAEGLS